MVGSDGGLLSVFNNFHNKPLIAAVGNHDMVCMKHCITKIIPPNEMNYYYVVNNISVMVAFLFHVDPLRSFLGSIDKDRIKIAN